MKTTAGSSKAFTVWAVVGGVLLVALAIVDLFALVVGELVLGMASDPCAYQACHSEGNADLGIKVLVFGIAGGASAALIGYLWAIRSRRRVAALMPLAGLAITAVAYVLGAYIAAPTL